MAMDIQSANFRLIIVLHYVTKLSWLLLAALFGYIGYKLTVVDIAAGQITTGKANVDIGGYKMSVEGISGLVLMVVALLAAVVGAVKSKVVFKDGETNTVFSKGLPMPDRVPAAQDRGNDQATASCAVVFERLLKFFYPQPKARTANAIVSATGEVVLQSMGWRVLPESLQAEAISHARSMAENAGPGSVDRTPNWKTGSWDIAFRIVQQRKNQYACAVRAIATDEAHRGRILTQETAPIFLED